jgi:hypothetical protein
MVEALGFFFFFFFFFFFRVQSVLIIERYTPA